MAKAEKRLVGIDFGMARFGLSISDPSKIIAMPLHTLTCEKKSEDTAEKLIHFLADHQQKLGYELEGIVIGLPLMMSGKQGFLADEVKHFAEVLAKLTSAPIIFWDERLTTVQAERSLSSLSRKKRSKIVDTVSSVIILQSYLDSRS